jgi:hypothetical protein
MISWFIFAQALVWTPAFAAPDPADLAKAVEIPGQLPATRAPYAMRIHHRPLSDTPVDHSHACLLRVKDDESGMTACVVHDVADEKNAREEARKRAAKGDCIVALKSPSGKTLCAEKKY